MSEFTDAFETMPSTLKSLMGHLFNNNILNGWNIFENRDGVVIVNIRFRQDTLQPGVFREPISFRRLSTNQINRNRQRSQVFQNKFHDSPNTINKKRKISNASPEIIREDSEHLSCVIDTPDSLSFKPLEYNHNATVEQDNELPQVPLEDTITHDRLTVEYAHTTSEGTKSLAPVTFVSDMDEDTSAASSDSVDTQVSPSPQTPSDCLSLNPLSAEFIPDDLLSPAMLPKHNNAKEKALLCPCCSEKMTVTHECMISPEEDSLSTSEISDFDPCVPSPPPRPSPKPPDISEAEKGQADQDRADRMARTIEAILHKMIRN